MVTFPPGMFGKQPHGSHGTIFPFLSSPCQVSLRKMVLRIEVPTVPVTEEMKRTWKKTEVKLFLGGGG